MKIGYFTNTEAGISETFIYDLITSLDIKTDLYYFTGNRKTEKQIVKNQFAIGFADFKRKLPYYAYKIGRMIGDNGSKYKDNCFQYYANKALKKNLQKINIDVAYIDYGSSAVLLADFFTKHKIPFVVHVHGSDITSQLNNSLYKERFLKLFDTAQKFIVASNYMSRLLILLGCTPNKIELVRYGIDGESIEPLSWKERLKIKPTVTFVGRLTSKKHPIALLHAFKIVLEQIPEAKLIIVGDGVLKNEVEQRIETLNISDNVKLKGALPREDSFKIINQSHVFAQHSVTSHGGDQEGYAISPAEAALHELPVVSTFHNGIPEHVIDGKTGFLVKEFDFETMGQKIVELLQNPTLSEQMGKAGRENILKLNVPKQRVEKIISILERCIN